MKNTIKALDYDPFEAANAYDDEVAEKAAKVAAREASMAAKAALMAEKRAKVVSRLKAKEGSASGENN